MDVYLGDFRIRASDIFLNVSPRLRIGGHIKRRHQAERIVRGLGVRIGAEAKVFLTCARAPLGKEIGILYRLLAIASGIEAPAGLFKKTSASSAQSPRSGVRSEQDRSRHSGLIRTVWKVR